MATKKAKKGKKKPTLDGGETPITIGGGGTGLNPRVPLPLTIAYDPTVWDPTRGILTLRGGKFRKIRITDTGGVEIVLPLTGAVEISLTCNKP